MLNTLVCNTIESVEGEREKPTQHKKEKTMDFENIFEIDLANDTAIFTENGELEVSLTAKRREVLRGMVEELMRDGFKMKDFCSVLGDIAQDEGRDNLLEILDEAFEASM